MGGLRQLAMRAGQALLGFAAPPPGRIAHYDPTLDAVRQRLTGNLTFTRIESILAAGKDGQLGDTLQFFEEMELRWGRLGSVAATRRMAFTSLDWEIVSAADQMETAADKTLADEAAALVREKLKGLAHLRGSLKHLATAVGRNLAVCEVEWANDPQAGLRPVDIFPVHSERLTMQPWRSPEVHIIIREERLGIPASVPKFIVCVPNATSGSPLWRSLAEGHAWLFLIWKLALSDWGTFCELFGIPFRHAKYPPNATAAERGEIQKMLETMGSSGWAMTSSAVTMDFVESTSRGVTPFEGIINFCDRSAAQIYLGGNLVADTTGGTGTFSAAKVQDEVRGDLRDDDIQNESDCLGEQLIAPICAFAFPGKQVSLPIFRRIKPETVDRVKEANAIHAAQGVGIAVGEDWARKRLSIPRPAEGEEVLEPVDAFTAGVTEGNPAAAP